MADRRNVACLLLAVAGLSFGVGQSVGQDRASADPNAARVVYVQDTRAERRLQTIMFNSYWTCKAIRTGESVLGCQSGF